MEQAIWLKRYSTSNVDVIQWNIVLFVRLSILCTDGIWHLTICGPSSYENPEIPSRLNPIPQMGTHGLWLVFSVLLSALTLGLVAGRTPGHRSVKKLSKLSNSLPSSIRSPNLPSHQIEPKTLSEYLMLTCVVRLTSVPPIHDSTAVRIINVCI